MSSEAKKIEQKWLKISATLLSSSLPHFLIWKLSDASPSLDVLIRPFLVSLLPQASVI